MQIFKSEEQLELSARSTPIRDEAIHTAAIARSVR